MSRWLRAFTAIAPLCAACSLVLDFPEQVAGGGGGEGGGGGAGGAGGSPQICPPQAPTVAAFLEPAAGGASNYVTVTGLARRDGAWLDLYGESGSAMADYDFPSIASNLLFAIRAPDGGVAFPLGSIVACAPVPGYSLAGRVSLTTAGALFLSGSVPAQTETQYGFAPGEDDVCSSAPLPIASNDADGASVPFFALLEDTRLEPFRPDPSYYGNGTTLGSAVGGGITAGLGAGNAVIFDATSPGPEARYFLVRSPERGGQNEVAFLELASVDDLPAELEGGIAADPAGTLWATGRGCDVAGPCSDRGELFVAVWRTEDAEPTTLPVVSSELSFGTAARAGGGRVFVGGGFRGQLQLGSQLFEPSEDTSAFVAALDPATGETEWTYPAVGVTPGFDTTGEESIVDLAYVDAAGCGRDVVVAAGCIAAQSAANPRCGAHRSGDGGRYTFIVLLDAATGEELYATELLPNDTENDLLLPTALAADGSGFWLATSLRGRVELPSPEQPTDSGGTADALVLFFGL